MPVVTGCQNQGTQNSTVITVKYNTSGQLLWVDNFTAQYANRGTGRAVTTDKFGNTIVGAETDSANFIGYSILKYDTLGNLIFHNKYTPASCLYSRVSDLIFLENGNIVMVGYFSDGQITKGIITETNNLNQQVYSNIISSNTGDATLCAAISDVNNNIYVTGDIQGLANKDLLLQKYSYPITLNNLQTFITDDITHLFD